MSGHRDTPGLSAITFLTADMAAACSFWSAAGFAVAYGGPDSRFTSYTAGGGTFVNLSTETAPANEMHRAASTARWGRMIIHVTSPDDTHAALTAAGYQPHAEPADAPWGERYFHVTDPDGNEISFARPLKKSTT